MESDAVQVRVEAGEGVVFRDGDAIVLAFAATPAQQTQLDELLETVATADDDSRRLVRRIVGRLAQAEVDDVPDFAVVIGTHPGAAVLISGSIDVVITGADGTEERLSGRSVSSWLDRVIDTEVGGRPGASQRPRRGRRASPFRPTSRGRAGRRLRGDGRRAWCRGIAGGRPVRGRTVGCPRGHRSRRRARPDPKTRRPTNRSPRSRPPPPPPAAVPADAEREFVSVDLSEPVADEVREPLPVTGTDTAPSGTGGPEVAGILCSRQHFNDPAASFCAVCGISMVHQTHNLVRGQRPPLGVLLADDGSTYSLDRDYVVGRDPSEHELVVSGEASPLPLDDADRTISRAHARVMLQDWDVRVVDLGSANGTHVAAPNQTEWTALHAGEPVTVQPGTRILVGQRTFVYDSHHRV